MSRWLQFSESENQSREKKTKVWIVQGKHNGITLGVIKWYSRWRQYVFHPRESTLFNGECLDDLQKFVREETRKHREKGH